MAKELSLEVMHEIMSRADGGETLSDEILQIVIDEVTTDTEGAEARIRERVTQLPEHPAAYFLLGFAVAGAIVWVLS
ncbi:hypothetical protein FGG78_17145 [Thioclava sp. BHET1]|nr:hypothetical protein FGG78_17145 [Thioclava sp. BHET1]